MEFNLLVTPLYDKRYRRNIYIICKSGGMYTPILCLLEENLISLRDEINRVLFEENQNETS